MQFNTRIHINMEDRGIELYKMCEKRIGQNLYNSQILCETCETRHFCRILLEGGHSKLRQNNSKSSRARIQVRRTCMHTCALSTVHAWRWKASKSDGPAARRVTQSRLV